MESFQPGLSFSPVNRAEIDLGLHGNTQPGVTQNCSSSEAKISPGISKRAETRPGLKFPSCNCSLYFTRILFLGRAEISARQSGLKTLHVITP